jgi:zinc protease
MCALSSVAWADGLAVKAFPEYQTYETVLKNGLKVIVREDHRAPVMVSQVWYKVGSSYEPTGITGVSHVLEHMMFKGTEKLGPNEFSRIISANGGKENAFTGRDYTSYFQQMEKTRLAVSFEHEADRMRNLKLNADEFAKEIKVVMEERRMRTEDDPQALTYEQFNATAYSTSPYHHPVIGWMDDLEHMTVQDLSAWYQQWYGPNNATLVVAGDLNHKEVFALAEKYFGDLKPSEITPPKPRAEVAQRGERRVVIKAPAQLPFFMMGYKTPSVVNAQEEWEPYALSVLAAVLDGGNSARFAKRLVRGDEIAASISTSYDPFTPAQEVFTFSGTPTQNHSVADLEKAIKKQIDILKKEAVSEQELARVKAQVVASKIYEKDSLFYQAMSIGMMETTRQPWILGEQ